MPKDTGSLVSATYIPGGEGWGPGVGIPPPDDLYYDPSNYTDTQMSVQTPIENTAGGFNSMSTYGMMPHAPRQQTHPAGIYASPGQTGTQSTLQPHHSQRHPNQYMASQQPLSPSDPGYHWPLERVVQFLQSQNFPKEWIEVFKQLDVHGNMFLDIGRHRGNLALLHEQVYPRLADRMGDRFDVQTEMDRRKILRRAIRKILEQGDPASNASLQPYPHKREASVTSAGTDGNAENSPSVGPSGTPTTAGAGDDSPERYMPAPGTNSSLWQRRTSTSSRPQGHYISENGRSEWSREALSMAGDGKRHSRNASQEFREPTSASARDGARASPQPSPGLQGKTWAHGKTAHVRDPSTESSQSRRNALEGSRPSPQDTNRPVSDPPVKEHKGIFYHLKRKNKKDDHLHPSPDESSVDSPTSPANHRQPMSGLFALRLKNGSEASLNHQKPNAGSRASIAEDDGKRIAFVTPDGINYRLVDVSKLDSASALRAAVADALSISSVHEFTLHCTSALQVDHEDALSDDSLLYAKRSLGDGIGTLKLWANAPSAVGTNFAHVPHRMSVMGQFPRTKSDAPPLSASEEADAARREAWRASLETAVNADLPESERRAQLEAAAEEHKKETSRKQAAYFESKRKKLQQANSPISNSDSPSITGRTVDFDNRRESPFESRPRFDPNRLSRGSKELVSTRPPPAAPADSKMLQKVNSLSKKGHQTGRTNSRGSGELRSAAAAQPILENDREKGSAESATPAMTVALEATRQSSSSPLGALPGSPGTITMSKGHIPFLVPDYNSDHEESPGDTHMAAVGAERPNLTLQMPGTQGASLRNGPTPKVVPWPKHVPAAALARMESKRGAGPTFDFKEPKIDFAAKRKELEAQTPDDGLFAVQLNRAPSKGKSKAAKQDEIPPLIVRTSKVQFQSPHSERFSASTADPDDPYSENIHSAASASSNNPDDWELKANRRRSFASDVWAARPSAEGIVDNLDEFFPNINLDQPVIPESVNWGTDNENSMPPHPTGYAPLGHIDEHDTLGSDESTLKAKDTIGSVASVAQRQIQRSSGLNRAKSIREVVQRNYLPGANTNMNRPYQSPAAVPALPNRVATIREGAMGAIVRRKSTKMFGAKIEQVKPNRGSRLINLDTIPQEDYPQTSATVSGPAGVQPMPSRQPTFKWVRGQLIGKGTFGRVYLGMNIATGEFLAVKQVEVDPKAAGREKERLKEMVRSLDIEIDTMEPLEHPNIVSYLGCERKEFAISIFLEYIPGGSIGSVLRKHGKFQETVVSSLTRQCLQGLSYLHNEGILHRDLKADNILLDIDGSAKISDFGISKKTDNIYGNDETNSMQGSVFWMAPEVIRSHGQGYSAKVDIWSLGCVVLEMFAGRRPWSKEEAIGAIYKLGELNEAPPIPDDVSEAISPQALSFMFDCFTM
jgi:mitogen-activated protein kinase kinase kinase